MHGGPWPSGAVTIVDNSKGSNGIWEAEAPSPRAAVAMQVFAGAVAIVYNAPGVPELLLTCALVNGGAALIKTAPQPRIEIKI